METKAGKTEMAKIKGRRSKRGSKKKTRRESGVKEKEAEKGKDNRCEKSSRGLGNLG